MSTRADIEVSHNFTKLVRALDNDSINVALSPTSVVLTDKKRTVHF